MKCSFCKHTLLYVNKIERNAAHQMILYKCGNCKINYKTFILDKKMI